MKIKVTVTETVWKTLIVDTDDFVSTAKTIDETVFELAEHIISIKNDPKSLLKEYNNGVEVITEINNTEVKPIN